MTDVEAVIDRINKGMYDFFMGILSQSEETKYENVSYAYKTSFVDGSWTFTSQLMGFESHILKYPNSGNKEPKKMRVFFIFGARYTNMGNREYRMAFYVSKLWKGLQRFDHYGFGTTSMSKIFNIRERDYDVTKTI